MAPATSRAEPPLPPLQNPISGTTIDTDPSTLGLPTSNDSYTRTQAMAQLVREPAHHGRGESETRGAGKPHLSGSISGRTQASTSLNQNSTLYRPTPSRPGIAVLRGDGSLRAGTQLLIQALQAVPWEDEADNIDDQPPLENTLPAGPHPHPLTPLSSSIHTIYRPIARSRRNTPAVVGPNRHASGYFPEMPPTLPPDSEGEGDSDLDFEHPQHSPSPTAVTPIAAEPNTPGVGMTSPPNHPVRSASLATVRVTRRARLASKLREIFEIKEISQVLAEIPCWLLRSVLLQGYMYLTNSHLCFFAHIPAREDQVLKSGSLYKKTTRTKRWVKRWFILKNDVLSWYQTSSDPYFPHGVVDLRYAISCESVSDKDILLKTNQKIVLASADSSASRDEWVKAIQKVIFKAQNMGESVQIAIPYSTILEVDRSHAMNFSDTLEVKVVDNQDNCLIESYFFAYFNSMDDVLKQINEAIRVSHLEPVTMRPPILKDTTHRRPDTLPQIHEETSKISTNSMPEPVNKSGFRFPSILRSLGSKDDHVDHSAGVLSLGGSSAQTSEPQQINTRSGETSNNVILADSAASSSISSFDHTYPPSPSPPGSEIVHSSDSQNNSWSVSVPSWLKGSSLKIFTGASSRTMTETAGGVSETYTQRFVASPEEREEDHEFDIVESNLSSKHGIDLQVEEKFRRTFAVDDKEELLGHVQGYILRVLPVHGRFYISTRYLSFRSSQSLIKTRMMVPIRDIIAAQQCKAFQFGCYGLLIVIKGHEELFFEFRGSQRRALCIRLLERQMDVLRDPSASDQSEEHPPGNIVLEELEPADLISSEDPRPPPEGVMEALPAVMFTSASSTFLNFKPQNSLRFTFLTIGSRGDVQPYIALAKGLMADGHSITIATHQEYEEWITSHGIGFASVGGDPAELMRICVENGMFTVSFLKETLSKFRGWLDDLLKSSWEACQGSDVLVESPSAMGGIHIAEALRIPYFRAFTMPWTRTRVYPHAFAVPERKMGGSYNYMSYVMFDQVFWRATSGQINRWRRNYLGIAPTSLDKMMQHKVPFLYNFSPSVVPPPIDWTEWIRVTGYWFLEDAEVSSMKWEAPADLVSFIDDAHEKGGKVVYIGFGSIVVSDPVAMTECVVQAIEKSGVHAILSKGWSDRFQDKKGIKEELGNSPMITRQIFEIASIPHDWLFARIDAACHHGGAGTTGASLRAGIPTIIKPFFGDQYFWSDRIEDLGVGTSIRKLTVDSLASALQHATTDIKQIDRARLLGQAIRSENGVQTAVEAIYRDLEYARTLANRNLNHGGADMTTGQSFLSRGSPPDEPIRKSQSSFEGSRISRDGAPSEDWSIVSDEDDPKVPVRSKSVSRRKLVTKPLHALQDALSSATSSLSQVL